MMNKQFAELTGVRGAAATWVVIFHAYPVFGPLFGAPDRWEIPVVRDGFLAVDLFFVLSGFVLSLAYHDRIGADFRSGLGEFLVARICRVMPLHWFCLTVFALLATSFPHVAWGPGPFTLGALLASAALVQNWTLHTALAWNHPTWSLSAEWMAYLIFPGLIVAVMRLRDRRMAMAGILLSLFLLDGFLWSLRSTTLNHVGGAGLVRCLCEFSAGALAWKVYASVDVRSPRLAEGCTAFGLGLLVLAVATAEVQPLAPFGFVALILGCALQGPTATWLFGNRVMGFLGDISFSIYLSHIIILGCLGGVIERFRISDATEPVRLGVVLAYPSLLLLVAYLTWWLVEKPCQSIGRKHARRVTQQAWRWLDSIGSSGPQRPLAATALGFWLMAIVATTLGETAGDLLSMTLHLGYAASTIILMALVVVALAPQIATGRQDIVVQWSVILSMCSATTTFWDFLVHSVGLRHVDGALLLIGILLAVLAAQRWRAITGLVSAGHRASRSVDVLHWIALLLSITLATAGADFLTETCRLGYVDGAIVFGSGLAGVAALCLFTKWSAATLFWPALLLTRLFGVTLADTLTKPFRQGGLQIGTIAASLGLAALLSLAFLLDGRRRNELQFCGLRFWPRHDTDASTGSGYS